MGGKNSYVMKWLRRLESPLDSGFSKFQTKNDKSVRSKIASSALSL